MFIFIIRRVNLCDAPMLTHLQFSPTLAFICIWRSKIPSKQLKIGETWSSLPHEWSFSLISGPCDCNCTVQCNYSQNWSSLPHEWSSLIHGPPSEDPFFLGVSNINLLLLVGMIRPSLTFDAELWQSSEWWELLWSYRWNILLWIKSQKLQVEYWLLYRSIALHSGI